MHSGQWAQPCAGWLAACWLAGDWAGQAEVRPGPTPLTSNTPLTMASPTTVFFSAAVLIILVRAQAQPTAGGNEDGVAAGGRCASGFCVDLSNCPQCASGLTCTVQEDQICAGTCFGVCTLTTEVGPDFDSAFGVTPPVDPGFGVDPPSDLSVGCLQYYDGCNSCSRDDAYQPLACTMMMCFVQGTPQCHTYASGFGGH